MAAEERLRLLKQASMTTDREKKWLQAARDSPAAKRFNHVLAKFPEQQRERIKEETFQKLYEYMGQELEGDDLERVVVVRNEVSGLKTKIFFGILTLGLYLIFGGRDDDIILVLTKQGTVLQLKIDRPLCCPGSTGETFFAFLKYMGILFVIVVVPNLIYMIFFNITLEDEWNKLKEETDDFQDIPKLIEKKYPFFVCSGVALAVWLYSLVPHGYMDEHRRRHMVRECTTAQMCEWGMKCRRRSSLRLYFGKYPNQTTLDLQGSLGFGRAAGPVPLSSLSAAQAGTQTSSLIFGMTAFLTLATVMDTTFAWMDRTIAVKHFAAMQTYCVKKAGSTASRCNLEHCEDYMVHHHDEVSPHFCNLVQVSDDKAECAKYGTEPPCCGGCSKGGFEGIYDEGELGNIKTIVSLVADTGTILFTLLAAKYAISMVRTTDNIELIIRRRTKSSYRTETANTKLTSILANDFAQTVMNMASKDHGASHNFEASDEDKEDWAGVRHFYLDEDLETWSEFFKGDVHSFPDSRWSLKLKVPKRLLGIEQQEEVIAGWVEMPLLPPPVTLMDILSGKILYLLLPFGKTRHAVIVTDRRLFYMRHRRPFLPFNFLGTALRIDIFRHDHDVLQGRMLRHKLGTPQRIIHQILLREQFLPGTAIMQTKFGALQLTRNHGDIVDVYNLIMSLSRNVPEFITQKELTASGVNAIALEQLVKSAFTMANSKSGNRWTMNPQPDDAVQPQPTLYLATGSKERILYHLSVKDTTDVFTKYYFNLDVAVTTARVFFWKRSCYKKFDCCALLYWLFIWIGCLNRINNPINLHNEMSFMTLPSILSFSTDMSIDSPSCFVPHHMPLKWPCVEVLCAYLTRLVVRGSYEVKSRSKWSACPRRSGPSAHLYLLWRLKQSAHADTDMMIVHVVKPYVSPGMPLADAQDIYDGIGFIADQEGEAAQSDTVETLRKIMFVVQDACHRLLNDVDDLGGGLA